MDTAQQQLEVALAALDLYEVDDAAAAVLAAFPAQTWREQPLDAVIAVAVAGATALDRRYQVSLRHSSFVPFLWRAVAVDTAAAGMPLVAHRVGFSFPRVEQRVMADVDKLIEAEREAARVAERANWRERVKRESPAKGSWDDLRLFWAADDRDLDEVRIAALRAQGVVGRCDPQGYTLEPGDPDCEGVIHLP